MISVILMYHKEENLFLFHLRRRVLNIKGVYRIKKRGFTLISTIVILFIISILSICSLRIIINNKNRVKIKKQYTDIYGLDCLNDDFTYINKFLYDNPNMIENLINGQNVFIDSINVSLRYSNKLDKVIIYYADSEVYARYKNNKSEFLVFPEAKKY